MQPYATSILSRTLLLFIDLHFYGFSRLFGNKSVFELKIGVPYQNVSTEDVNEWRSKNKEQKRIRKLKRCGCEVSKIVA